MSEQNEQQDILSLRKRSDRIDAQVEKKKQEIADLLTEQKAIKKQLTVAGRSAIKEEDRKVAEAEAELERVKREAAEKLEALAPFLPKSRASRKPKDD